ncbi:archaetidylserine decarboxylase [Catenovulum sp. 2E275]|uniref:archaetidylserine decarboxylase n=1 Tax=Catenovulum sp. 2E275 TaxID=2980497 RepID=UPI0021D3A026|nr:archaetidylserine decarboxylase [Catenovulum sp. 2E275]MCU4674842.1 archaetidylserine decarboxylase [Catenovulum sp. 2E275]
MSLEKFKVALQYCTPQHTLSRIVGSLAASKNKFISQTFIKQFARAFNIDLSEAQIENFAEFKSFNEFFTRALKPDARPIDFTENVLVSPVDGEVSQAAKINQDSLIQAKGHDYSLTTLLGGDEENARPFQNGEFTTIYLSPSDYHRIHMPCDGTLTKMIYVPGKLFSVNQATTRNVPGLFARNERLVCFFDTEFGEMAMVLVGAMIVASIETVWAGNITPPAGSRSFTWHYSGKDQISLKKGQEMGRFKLGSTVILAMPENTVEFDHYFKAEAKVKLGESIATISTVTGA